MSLNFNDILLLIKNNKFSESIEHLDKLIIEDENNFDYYYLRGVSYLNSREFIKAIEDFSSAINIKDDNFLTYHFRGISYLKLNNLDKANDDFNKLISIKSNFPEVYNNLGFLLYAKGKNELAIVNFTKSIELNINYKQAISGLINALSHTENVQINDSKIIDSHNKINKINFYYSPTEYIKEENIRDFLKNTNDIIDKNLKNLEFNMTQTYRRDQNELNCKRHKKIFNNHDVIPEYCFGCYKVQIELSNVIDLIRLYILFNNLELKNNNIRKCMIEFRPNIPGSYKGLIYCNSLEESEYIQNQIIKILDKNFNKQLLCKIKRGCTEFGMKYSEYDNLTNDAMTYKPEWKMYENSVDEKNLDLLFKRIIRPSIKGISLNDILIIRNWLAYARMIGDNSCKDISNQTFNSNFIKRKLKLRNSH